jgi:quercetin dioxygenase-like cupin family protein
MAEQENGGTGFVLSDDGGEAFWFLNTLTINKVGGQHTCGGLAVVDHRVPAGFAPPPHIHRGADEAFYILEGDFEGFCGDTSWKASPRSLVFLPRDIPHGFTVSQRGPGRALLVLAPAGFEQFVAALGEPAGSMELPQPVQPDVPRVIELAAAHGIEILPPPNTE